MGWGGFDYPWAGEIDQGGFEGATSTAQTALAADIYAEYNFVLEGQPYRRSTAAVWPDVWGAFPWGSAGIGGDESIRYSYRGFVTSTTDTPANTYMPAVLSNPVNYQNAIPVSGVPGEAAFGRGAVEFAADVDDDIESTWAGRNFSLKFGGTYHDEDRSLVVMDYADYTDLYNFRAVDLEYNENTAQLLVRDYLDTLDHPIQTSTYAGTGTMEGDDQIKGQYKPLCFGKPFNVPAVLVDSANFVYQFNDGAVSDITDVRINGKSQTDAGDTTDLLGWTGGSSGQYKTDVSRGLIRLWSQPDGEVTADVEMTTSRANAVLIELVENAGALNIDYGSFNSFYTPDIGVYVGTSPETIRAVILNIVQQFDGWMNMNRRGQVCVGRHLNPDDELPIVEIEGRREADSPCVIANIQKVSTPNPPASVRVAYKRNWSPQNPGGLDSTLTEANKQLYASEFGGTTIEVKVLSLYPDAKELVINNAVIITEADAETIRDEIIDRASGRRSLFSVDITAPLFRLVPGQIVKLFYDRFDLDAGKNGEIIEVLETTELTTLLIMVKG
jgi:hypothetical protein